MGTKQNHSLSYIRQQITYITRSNFTTEQVTEDNDLAATCRSVSSVQASFSLTRCHSSEGGDSTFSKA